MKLTLSVDERTLEEARKVAESMGKSLNQLIEEYLGSLARRADADRWVDELYRLSSSDGAGHSRGWKFNRDEIHERS
jgi:hypothetical protein